MRRAYVIILALVAILFMPDTISSYNQYDFPPSIKTPRELANWLNSDFIYIIKIPDYKQTPDETLKRRAGDCEDFAYLSRAILASLGVKSDVVIIRFRQIELMHAICLFKEGAVYSFISNRSIIRTHGITIDDAVSEAFPDWDLMTIVDEYGRVDRVTDRKHAVFAGSSCLSVASAYGCLLGPEHRDMGIIRFALEGKLNSLTRSGMQFNANTFVTIFKDIPESRVRFLFDKIRLTSVGFIVDCLIKDESGVRRYDAVFSTRPGCDGFVVSVFHYDDLNRVSQFNDIVPHCAAQ